MKFEELRARMADRPYFRPEDMHMGGLPAAHELVQLSHWTGEGKILRLKKGFYTLSQDHRRRRLSTLELAEPLYRPSYISLEWALSRYGLIPEAVGTITSITPLKTARFRNSFCDFAYKHVASDYFFGYSREVLPAPHFLASPEKALLDFIHLSIPRSQALTVGLLLEGYRLQNLKCLKKRRLVEAIAHFNTPRVQQGGSIILDLLRRIDD